jgi:hypothetical protein
VPNDISNAEVYGAAVAIVTALHNGDAQSYTSIVYPMTYRELGFVVAAIGGLAYGMARKVAEHEGITADELLQRYALEVIGGET